MSIQLNRNSYEKIIAENIKAIQKNMPEYSLEKQHTIDVLKWSIDQIYGKPDDVMRTSHEIYDETVEECARDNYHGLPTIARIAIEKTQKEMFYFLYGFGAVSINIKKNYANLLNFLTN